MSMAMNGNDGVIVCEQLDLSHARVRLLAFSFGSVNVLKMMRDGYAMIVNVECDTIKSATGSDTCAVTRSWKVVLTRTQ